MTIPMKTLRQICLRFTKACFPNHSFGATGLADQCRLLLAQKSEPIQHALVQALRLIAPLKTKETIKGKAYSTYNAKLLAIVATAIKDNQIIQMQLLLQTPDGRFFTQNRYSSGCKSDGKITARTPGQARKLYESCSKPRRFLEI